MMAIVNGIVFGSLVLVILGLVVVMGDPERRFVLRWIPIPSLRGTLRIAVLLIVGVIGAGVVAVMTEGASRVRVFMLTSLSTNAVALIMTALALGAFVAIERWAKARREVVIVRGLDVGKLLLLAFVLYMALLFVLRPIR
jgi:hypothetical protein